MHNVSTDVCLNTIAIYVKKSLFDQYKFMILNSYSSNTILATQYKYKIAWTKSNIT
jgi:hypothetical protein